jgi:hypothetical protein
MRALMAAVVQMARDETKAATDQDLQISFRNVREMTKIAEHEIHAIVLSCARAPAGARSIAHHKTDAALTRCHWQLVVRLWRICLRRSETKILTTDIADSDSVNHGSNPGCPASY